MKAKTSDALVPQLMQSLNPSWTMELSCLTLGVFALALLAQLTIVLPWTPVPITGQTLGVTLVALSLGRKRAVATFVSYFILGSAGLPLFAMAKSGLSFGPTFGYLIGMLASSFVVGYLADQGYTKSFTRALAASMVGSLLVFSFGLLGLSFFIPNDKLLMAGLIPFLPGDLLKNLIAASVSKILRNTLSLRKS